MIDATLVSSLRTITSGSNVYAFNKPLGKSFPCITYQSIGTKHYRTLSGSSTLNTARFQLDCWGESLDSVLTLSGSVINLLDANTSVWEVSTVDNNFAVKENDTKLYRVIIECSILNK